MHSEGDKWTIRADDLYAPQVDAFVETQEMLQRALPEIEPQPMWRRILLSGWFILGFAGLLGGLAGWKILDPYMDDDQFAEERMNGQILVSFLLFFPVSCACIGLFVSAADGIVTRRFLRALTNGLVSVALGFVGGIVLMFAIGILIALLEAIGLFRQDPLDSESLAGLVLHMVRRSMIWALVAVAAGMGQGVALWNGKLLFNGILGAMLGGLIGGLIFDPTAIFCLVVASLLDLEGPTTGSLSRAVGVAAVGLMVGIFTGLVEQWTKTAWLQMRVGPLAGKQFVLYRNPTVLGSSPKADIYLFKDEQIEPKHALILSMGGRYEIEDCRTPEGTFVNGRPVKRQRLEAGDQIVLGKTVLTFDVREGS